MMRLFRAAELYQKVLISMKVRTLCHLTSVSLVHIPYVCFALCSLPTQIVEMPYRIAADRNTLRCPLDLRG
jgi:hypothetical protein